MKKQAVWLRRIVLVLAAAVAGAVLAVDQWRPAAALTWLFIAAAVAFVEWATERLSGQALARAGAGLLAGLVVSFFVVWALGDAKVVADWGGARLIAAVIFGYLGVVLAMRWIPGGSEKAAPGTVGPALNGKAVAAKLLDTSVIIDGRIAEVCDTGFLEGTLFIPRFVLQELQRIADSSDPLKRNRGRRGLDILNRMQKSQVSVEVLELDAPETREVDEKLLIIGKQKGAKIITNDFNLNKVAEIHGVAVLNINDLANALKPAVLPGEMLTIRVIKEGKESGQGIGYLDDGTMVVVDNGKVYMGQKIDVVVTSALQTAAGRMIFAKKKEEAGDILQR